MQHSFKLLYHIKLQQKHDTFTPFFSIYLSLLLDVSKGCGIFIDLRNINFRHKHLVTKYTQGPQRCMTELGEPRLA